MANTRRRTETVPSVAGAPTGTNNWVDTPSTSVGGPASPRIGDGEEWDIGNPYNPANNSGFAGGGTGSSNISNNPNGTPYIAPPNQNIGPWASGYGTQPVGVNIPNQPLNGQPAYTGGASSSGAYGASTNWGDPSNIDGFFRSRGITDQTQLDRLRNTWTGYYNQFGSRDPGYFWQRIQQENDLIGGPQNSTFAGSGGEFNDYWGSTLEGLIQQYLGNSTGRATELANTYRARAKELRDQPAYTSQDEAAIQAKAYDQLERRRQETLKNKREQVYARGFAPTSGLVGDAENNVNTQFEQARTGISSDILRAQLDETNRRKDAALQLEALATEALNGGDLSAIQATGLPLQLMDTRQNSALNTFNSSNGGNIGSILSMLLNSAGNQQQNNQQNSANNWSGIGGLLQLLGGLF